MEQIQGMRIVFLGSPQDVEFQVAQQGIVEIKQLEIDLHSSKQPRPEQVLPERQE